MIELQGSIDIQQSALHEKLETLTIGSLCMRPGVPLLSYFSLVAPSLLDLLLLSFRAEL